MTAQKRILRIPYPGISTRVTLPFLLVIAIIAGVAIFVVTRLVASSVQERFNNQLVDSARAARNTVVDLESQQLETLRVMVFTDGVAEAILEGDIADLDSALRPLAANAGLDGVIIFDAQGSGLVQFTRLENGDYSSTQFPDVSSWVGIQAIIQNITDAQGDKFVDVDPNYTDGMIYVSAPVIDADGNLIGGIGVGIRNVAYVNRIAAQSLSSVTLFLPNGNVLGTTFRGIDEQPLTLPAEPITADLDSELSSVPLQEIAVDGIPYQILYAPMELRGRQVGFIGVALPSNFIVESSSTSRNVFSILFATLFVAVAVLGLLVARTITRPVRQLVQTTRSIRDGDLSKRVGLWLPDELGELSVSFDHMTDQLVEKNQLLQELYLQREAVLSSISDVVIVQGLDGKTILRNQPANLLFEETARDTQARVKLREICLQPDRYQHSTVVELGSRYFNVIAANVRMQDESLLGYVIVLHDITQLLEAEHLKDKMMLQLSHELRTPLASARGYVELLQMYEQANISEQGHQFIHHTIDNMNVLERMINQVIDVSALVAKQFEIYKAPFDLVYVLEKLVVKWQSVAQERQLKLSFASEFRELTIAADQQRIEQVFDHLLRNACSYTLEGGSIGVFIDGTDQMARVLVVDNGVGIGEDEIDRVFERAYRGRSADAGPTDARGLGFGLYISKEVLELHQGQISLTSKADVGTVVTVLLPITQD